MYSSPCKRVFESRVKFLDSRRGFCAALALAALLFSAPALAYQVDDTRSPGLTDVILEHATAEALPLALVAYEVTTTKAPAAPGITPVRCMPESTVNQTRIGVIANR